MPKVSFTQFSNELARVLGTCLRASVKATTKSVNMSSEGGESVTQSQLKCEMISAQSSQIKDLRIKLDSAIAENTQMCEFFNPNHLQMAFTNALQAARNSGCHRG